MIKVAVYLNGDPVQEYEFGEENKEITIGRAPGCSLRLDEPSISRLHAVFCSKDDGWFLERKASFGAVLVNGEEIENAPILGGEEIVIGNFTLRINLDGGKAESRGELQENSRQSSASAAALSVNESDGTKLVSAGVVGLFRMEPGIANLLDFQMESDLAVFGRGSNCDVILTEKKASRKHFEVRKSGLSFFIKDLGSSNGTLVNGNKVAEVELVPGDLIEVGEAKIQFSIENQAFGAAQERFLAVPDYLQEQAPLTEGPIGAEGTNSAAQNISGMEAAGVATAASEENPKSLVGKFKKFYLSMPPRQRYLFIGIVFALIFAIFGVPGEDQKPKKPPIVKADGTIQRRIEHLSPDKKKFVQKTYDELVDAYSRKDWPKMAELSGQILSYVDVYKDTQSFGEIAKKEMAKLEEERRVEELKRKQEKIRKEVQAMEAEGRELFEKALKDAKFRPELSALEQKIIVKDPNNRLIGEWEAKIKEKDEAERKEAEAAREKEQKRQKAEDEYESVASLLKEKKYVKVFAEVAKLKNNGWDEEEYVKKVDKLKEDARTALDAEIEPWLKKAAEQRQEGGDLVIARDAYLNVQKWEPKNLSAKQGLDSIRETLHTRAKRYYTEAIIAESISDLTVAKERYEKCVRTAPEDDAYKKKCRNKLGRFDAFSKEEGQN